MSELGGRARPLALVAVCLWLGVGGLRLAAGLTVNSRDNYEPQDMGGGWTVYRGSRADYAVFQVDLRTPSSGVALASGPARGTVRLLQFDGQRWLQRSSFSGGGVWDMAASSPWDVWVISWSQLMHYDGVGWREGWLPTLAPGELRELTRIDVLSSTFGVVMGTSYEELFAWHFDGRRWTRRTIAPCDCPFNRWSALDISSPRRAFAGDEEGRLYVWDGSRWVYRQPYVPPEMFDCAGCSIWDIAAVSDDEAWATNHNAAGGIGSILHYDGRRWSLMAIGRPRGAKFTVDWLGYSHVEAPRSRDLWLLDWSDKEFLLYHWTGGDVEVIRAPEQPAQTWREVQAIAVDAFTTDVWFAASDDTLVRYRHHEAPYQLWLPWLDR